MYVSRKETNSLHTAGKYLRIILKYSVTWLLDTFTLHFMEYKTLTAQDEQEYTPQSLVFSAEKC